MKSLVHAAFVIMIFVLKTFSLQHITGEVKGELKAGEYFVTGTVYVLHGKSFKIAPGTRIYFEQFSGIKVLGSLYCKGTVDSPIVLTSKNEITDKAKNVAPEAFDWNGIEVPMEAEMVMIVNAKIRNCTFGLNIKSDLTKVSIRNVEFYNNGYSGLARGGKMVLVEPGTPFSVDWNIDNRDPPSFPVLKPGEPDLFKTNKNFTISNEISPPKNSDFKENHEVKKQNNPLIIAKIGAAAVVFTGAVLYAAGTVENSKIRDAYDDTVDPQKRDYLRHRYKNGEILKTVGGVSCIIGVAGFFITFLF